MVVVDVDAVVELVVLVVVVVVLVDVVVELVVLVFVVVLVEGPVVLVVDDVDEAVSPVNH